ncbi:MAG: NAD-dependent epimerase/dehydratase family protein [Dermatophilaceae bacterium]
MTGNGVGVVLAGAHGYLGAAIADELTRRGVPVTAVVRPGTDVADSPATSTVELELSDDDAPRVLRALMAGGAGYVHAATTAPEVTERVLDAAVGATDDPNRPVVIVQGALLYGPTGPVAVSEDVVPQVPPFLHDVAAVEGRFLNVTDARPVSIRVAGVHGRGGAVTGALAAAALADRRSGQPGPGNATWSMIHVDDVARLVHLAVTEPGLRGPLNGADEDLTVREVARGVAAALGLPGEPVAWDAEQARALLGFFAEPLTWDLRLSAARARQHGWTPRGPRFATSVADQFARGTTDGARGVETPDGQPRDTRPPGAVSSDGLVPSTDETAGAPT